MGKWTLHVKGRCVKAQKQKDKRCAKGGARRTKIKLPYGLEMSGGKEMEESALSAVRPWERKAEAASKLQQSSHDHLVVNFMCMKIA